MKTMCLETRWRKDGVRMRRYRATDDTGVSFTYVTGEVPLSVLHKLGAVRLKRALSTAAQTQELARRKAVAKHLLQQGWKALAVAHETGLCESTAHKMKRALRDKPSLPLVRLG